VIELGNAASSRSEALARFFGLRLQALEKIGGLLRVAGGRENRARVVFKTVNQL
jgi:hypothetical protein